MERISNELIAQVIGVSSSNIGERGKIYVIEDNRRFEKVKVLDK